MTEQVDERHDPHDQPSRVVDDYRELTPANKVELLRRVRYRAAEQAGEYVHFCRTYLKHWFTQPMCSLHEDFLETFARCVCQPNQREARTAPRGFAKSTHLKASVLFALAYCRRNYIWYFCDTQEQAMNHVQAVRDEIDGNRPLRHDFPWLRPGSVWKEHKIAVQSGAVLEAAGTGAAILGRVKQVQRPDYCICDDILNSSMTGSAKQREKVHRWFTQAMLPALAPDASVAFVGTPFHRADLLAATKTMPGWTSRTYRALLEYPVRMDSWKEWELIATRPVMDDREQGQVAQAARVFYLARREAMDEGAVLQWPDRFSLEWLMTKRAEIGERAFASQFQCAPIAEEDSEFPRDYFEGELWYVQPPGMGTRVMFVDPSAGRTEKADPSAIVLLGQRRDGKMYLDADVRRRDVVTLCEDIVGHVKRFNPQAVGVERNGFEAFGDLLLKMAAERQVYIPMYAVSVSEGKRVRIRRYVTPALANGLLRFRRGSPGAEEVLSQAQDYPHVEHDDALDSLAGALRLLLHLQAEGGGRGGEDGDDVPEVERVAPA